MKIKMCTKTELAHAYLPDIAPHSALNRVMSWIRRNTELMAELKAAGYYPAQKYLSPLQVELVMRYLGEP